MTTELHFSEIVLFSEEDFVYSLKKRAPHPTVMLFRVHCSRLRYNDDGKFCNHLILSYLCGDRTTLPLRERPPPYLSFCLPNVQTFYI